MKLTNADIYNTRQPFRKLLAVKLPVKVSLQVIHLWKKVEGPLAEMQSVVDKLIIAHGKQDRTGAHRISPEMEGFPKYAEELGELMTCEVELDFSVVMLPANIEIEPFVLLALEKFVAVEGQPMTKLESNN